MQRRFAASVLLLASALALSGAAKPRPKAPARPPAVAAQVQWDRKVTVTPEGHHILGNPNAPIRLVEFVSYSCPHCGIFEMQGGEELVRDFIRPGTASFEVRPFLRNELDLAASLLASCGPPARFFAHNSALLGQQDKWLRNPTRAQALRWSDPDRLNRLHAMAEDLALYDFMKPSGLSRQQLDQCLADEAEADRLQHHTDEAMERLNVTGTPTFLLNGAQTPENTWPGLRPRLQALLGGFT
ncbi:thioredoxin domain-containing protein [Novosphingobium sp. B 225]|uniref:thioredoxin domain-containing protein n=1 Tax=Novosphingobium sp. B 225 TaxID=1961849 RepID=UPI00159569B6|nr:thioredoxin domain-containing protein [Novosphingobium sp. B 225]